MSVAIGTFDFGLDWARLVAYQLIWIDFDSLWFESALYTFSSLHRYYLYSCS